MYLSTVTKKFYFVTDHHWIYAKQYSAVRKRKSMAYVECVIGCSRVRNQSEMDCGIWSPV